MNSEERTRLECLVRQVQEEQDPIKFDLYVRELNDLLEQKHRRIHPDHNLH